MRRIFLIVAALLFSSVVQPQTDAKANHNQALHVETQEVLLDFVARDKHEKLVTDLRPDEIQVYEDGVLQHLTSFRYRAGKAEPASGNRMAHEYDPLRELNVVSIVFEGMSADSRQRATDYALDFLKEGVGPNTWIGVFSLNHRLRVIQPYTNEVALLRAAVRRAGTGQYQTFAKESDELLKRMESLQAGTNSPAAWRYQPVSPGSAEEQGPATGMGIDAAKTLLAIQKEMLRSLYQQAGNRDIDNLRALVQSQAQLPGRKTVLYISEGLVIPPEQPELLRAVISDANRANVSFYTLDARGLQLTGSDHVTRLSTSAMNDNPFSSGSDIPLSLRTDTQSNARELAVDTGGFAMDNSNDLRAPLHRVMEDVHAHYEVTYTPQSQTLDGRFRAVQVKAFRPGLKLRSRNGYYAVPLLNGQPLTIYEMAALRALDTHPVPHAFDFHFSALNLRERPDGEQFAMAFSVPAKSILFEEDASADRFRVHVACMAIVKRMTASTPGNAGQLPEPIVAKVSKNLPYIVPASRRADFEAGMITVSIPLVLSPGRYHIEAVLLDVQASSASVKRVPLIVDNPPQSALEVSDFVWVRSLHPRNYSKGSDDIDPLDTNDGTITPDINGTFSTTQDPTFFFRIFRVSKPVTAQMRISRNGALLRQIALTLPPRAPDGAISVLGQIPVKGLDSGQYEVELAIQSGTVEISRLTELVLTPQSGEVSR